MDVYLAATNTGGPFGSERLTKGELRKAVEKIERLSSQLADLVDQVMPICLIDGINHRRPVSQIIRNDLPAKAREVLNRPRLLSKTKLKDPVTTVLVRELHRVFMERFGTPLLRIIADIHAIVLDSNEHEILDEQAVADIVRTAPNRGL